MRRCVPTTTTMAMAVAAVGLLAATGCTHETTFTNEDAGPCASCGADQICYQDACCTPQCTGRHCGPDGCGGTCGSCAQNWACVEASGQCTCDSEDDSVLCRAKGKECGELTADDRCGRSRTIQCDLCEQPKHCDRAAGECRCDSETAAAFCDAHGVSCGTLSAADNCGVERTEDCGSCPTGQACDTATGSCVCAPETDAAFCLRLGGRVCGPLSGADNCGTARALASCGDCGAGHACEAATGQCRTCESDQTFCARLHKKCGAAAGVDDCGLPRQVADCGTCTGSKICHSNGICALPGRATNDECTDPDYLTFDASGMAHATFDTSTATDSGDQGCAAGAGNDVVYTFTLTDPKDVLITATTTLDPTTAPVLAVRSSCEFSSTQVGCSVGAGDGMGTLLLEALPAGTYFLWVDSAVNAPTGPHALDVSLRSPTSSPANDLCVAAEALQLNGANTATVAGTTRGAHDDSAGSCSTTAGFDGADVAYSLTLTGQSAVRATVTRGSSATSGTFVPALYLLTGCPGAAGGGVEKACVLDADGDGSVTLVHPALAAGTYYLVVDGEAGTRGDFNLQVEVTAPVLNDACPSALALSFDPLTDTATQTADTTLLASDADASCAPSGTVTGPDTVYSFEIVGHRRNVAISVTPTPGSTLQPLISVRTQCDLQSTERTCAVNETAGGAATLQLNKLLPGTYYLWIDGANGSVGRYQLDVALTDPPPPPANDQCVAATPLTFSAATGNATSIAGTTVNAYDDGSGSCDAMDGADVFYSFTLGEASAVMVKVTADMSATNYRPRVYVRDSCGTGAQEKACGVEHTIDPCNPICGIPPFIPTGVSEATAMNLAAGTYYIVVDGSSASEGAFTLDLVVTPPIDNFDCTAARELVFDPATATATATADNSVSANATSGSCGGQTGYPTTGRELVYSFTIPIGGVDQQATIDVTPTTGSLTVPLVYTRSDCTTRSTELDCGFSKYDVHQRIKRLAPGTTTYVFVDGREPAENGTFSLTVALTDAPPIPANDVCAGALELSFDGATHMASVTGDTDPALADYEGSCVTTGSGAEVVYAITLAESRGLNVTVMPAPGSSYRPLVYLRSSCEDATSEKGCASALLAGASTQLTFPQLDAGTYYLVVDSVNAASAGLFNLAAELTAPPSPPAHDLCTGALALTWDTNTNTATATGNTAQASNDDVSYCSTRAVPLSGPDLVYSFTLGAAARVTATVTRDPSNATYLPAVSIRTSCGPTDEVACNRDDPQASTGSSTTTVSLGAGTFYVFVDGVTTGTNGTGFGPFTLTLTQDLAAVAAADGCGNVAPIPVDTATGIGTISGTTVGATNSGDGSCRSGTSNDRVYSLTLASEKTVALNLAPNGSGIYPVVYMRRTCDDPMSEMGCAYKSSNATAAVTIARVPAGTYYVWVDSTASNRNGPFTLTVTTTTPTTTAPANDTCLGAQALVIDGTSHGVHVRGDTSTATNDTVGSCGTGATVHSGGDLVYAFTLAQATTVHAVVDRDPINSSYSPALILRSVCDSTAYADEIACDGSTGAKSAVIEQQLQPGTYYLIIDGQKGTNGPFILDVVTYSPTPHNDSCPDVEAIALDSTGFGMTAGTTLTMTNSGQGNCFQNDGDDAVFSFTTTATKDVTIDLNAGGNLTPTMYVRSTCDDATSELACDYKQSSSVPVRLGLSRLPAGTYYVWVDGQSAGEYSAGPFTLAIQATDPQPAPAWDDCRNASALTFDGNGVATVTDNTIAGNDDYAGNCATSTALLNGPDLVYSFTISQMQAITARVTRAAAATNYKPAVYIRRTCDSASLVEEAACARDATNTSTAVATLPAGTYYVIVDGVGHTFGEFTLQVTQGAAVSGDNCMVAQALQPDVATGIATISGNTLQAGNSGDPTCKASTGGDFVYSFTVAREQTVDINITPSTGSSLRPVISLRRTCEDPAPSNEVTCVAGTSTSKLHWYLPRVAPGTYSLWIDSASATYSGAFTGTVAFSDSAPAPLNDTCTSATPVSFVGNVATFSAETWFAFDSGGATCDLGPGPDVVYAFTLSDAKQVVIKANRDSTTPNFFPLVYVRSTCDQSADTAELSCAAPNSSGKTTATINNLPAGTYYLWIDGAQKMDQANTPTVNTPGKANVTITLNAPVTTGPTNENCSSAQALTLTNGSVSLTTSSTGATSESTGRTDWCDAFSAASAGDVVYSVTTSTPGKLTATVTPSGSFAPEVYIRTVCGSPLAANELACTATWGGTPATAVARRVNPGTYWIWVDGAASGSSGGDFTLDVTLTAPAPANDTCAGAQVITSGTTYSGDTTDALDDYHGLPFTPECDAAPWPPIGKEVVYRYTPTASGAFTVTVTPAATYDPMLWYTTGPNCGSGLYCAIIVDQTGVGSVETMTITGVAGLEYDIYVDSALTTSAGAGTFSIRIN